MPADRSKLYLVDAMSNIHRAYHAIARLSTSAGKPTNAIYGFVTMLRKMLREHAPDYLAIAWDGPERTVRHEAYAEYKANRLPMAPDLASQIGDIRRVLDDPPVAGLTDLTDGQDGTDQPFMRAAGAASAVAGPLAPDALLLAVDQQAQALTAAGGALGHGLRGAGGADIRLVGGGAPGDPP